MYVKWYNYTRIYRNISHFNNFNLDSFDFLDFYSLSIFSFTFFRLFIFFEKVLIARTRRRFPQKSFPSCEQSLLISKDLTVSFHFLQKNFFSWGHPKLVRDGATFGGATFLTQSRSIFEKVAPLKIEIQTIQLYQSIGLVLRPNH